MVRLFITRIPCSMTGQNLSLLFSKYGRVSTPRVTVNRASGDSLGNTYLEMDFPSEAQIAINELNGFEIDGHKIGVSRAVKQ